MRLGGLTKIIDFLPPIAEGCKEAAEFVKNVGEAIKNAAEDPDKAAEASKERIKAAFQSVLVPTLTLIAAIAGVLTFKTKFVGLRTKLFDKVKDKAVDVMSQVLKPLANLVAKILGGQRETLMPPQEVTMATGEKVEIYVGKLSSGVLPGRCPQGKNQLRFTISSTDGQSEDLEEDEFKERLDDAGRRAFDGVKPKGASVKTLISDVEQLKNKTSKKPSLPSAGTRGKTKKKNADATSYAQLTKYLRNLKKALQGHSLEGCGCTGGVCPNPAASAACFVAGTQIPRRDDCGTKEGAAGICSRRRFGAEYNGQVVSRRRHRRTHAHVCRG